MLIKQGLKLHLMAASVLLLVAGGVYADSTTVPSFTYVPAGQAAAGGTAAVSGNQMFLLDSGDVNFVSNATITTAGYVCQPSNTASNCVGAINSIQRFHSNKNCPTGFVPYITTTISKSLDARSTVNSVANGVVAVCPTQFWAHSVAANGYSGYDFAFSVSAASSNGGLSGTAVAFHWDLYCYPGSYTNPVTPTQNNWTYSGCTDANPSSCSGSSSLCSNNNFAPTYSYDQLPMLLETGTWDHVLVPPANYWISTTRTCPANYTPAVELHPYKGFTTNAGSNTEDNKIFACPISAVPDGNNFKPSGSGYAIKINTSTENGNSNVGVKWSIYCYPQAVSIPSIDTACWEPGQVDQTYSQTFNFGQSGNATYGPQNNNSSVYNFNYAQYYNSNNQGQNWMLAFSGNQYNSQPYWNTYFQVPVNGTYMLTLSLTIYNTDTNGSCQLALYLSPGGNGFYMINGQGNNSVRLPIPAANWPNPGIATTAEVMNSVYLTAGTLYSIYGGQWNSTCNTLYVLSNGSLTVTRIGN